MKQHKQVRQYKKLRRLLRKNHFIFYEEMNTLGDRGIDLIKVQIINPDKSDFNTISIANGFCTEGGYNDENPNNQGLLELYNHDTQELKGYLKAKDVLEYLNKERGETNV